MATIAEQYNEVTLSLQSSRNTIRNKLVELGIAASADTLDKLALAIESIVNQGAVSIQVKEGETVTIPAGFHNGGGTVAGVTGGGNYLLQSKTVTPTKKQQTTTSDAGYYGLDSVVINPIPDAYQDVSGVTAGAEDVLIGKIIVLPNGVTAAGTMPDNGEITQILDVTTLTYTIPKGRHSGTGTVKIVAETKSVTPTKSAQKITPAAGKVLTEVNVGAIPDQYQDVTPVNTQASHVLDGDIFVDAAGKQVEGTMPNNSGKNVIVTGKTGTSIPRGYYDGSGVAKISEEDAAKIVPSNIKEGVTILGITGSFGADDISSQSKEVMPTFADQQISPDTGYTFLSGVLVRAIPVLYTDNNAGGQTVTIG